MERARFASWLSQQLPCAAMGIDAVYSVGLTGDGITESALVAKHPALSTDFDPSLPDYYSVIVALPSGGAAEEDAPEAGGLAYAGYIKGQSEGADASVVELLAVTGTNADGRLDLLVHHGRPDRFWVQLLSLKGRQLVSLYEEPPPPEPCPEVVP